MNKIGIQAAMYCNNGMECNEETKIMLVAEIIRRETDRPTFLKGIKNIIGTIISGKI